MSYTTGEGAEDGVKAVFPTPPQWASLLIGEKRRVRERERESVEEHAPAHSLCVRV